MSALTLTAQPAWHWEGACRETDPELFYAGGADERAAKQVCAACPVRAQCLDWALGNDELWGVWGGLNRRERARLNGRRTLPHDPDRIPRSGPPRCGTEQGYRRHINRGEPADPACRKAHAVESYERRHRVRKGAAS